ncbi:FAD-binding and (Fe-S)-binding domain-containing protein [Demequina sp. SYSU T00039]|uniref:FAD-binding and (Fe-S)-binding domain-containing protein n=1 Tax=Demequina lignilytica TaxID=3051663 RepID=A0AAW7M8X1_9MICO|nr:MULTISPECIES: FAD-binding and (Fe-S)-binding domain-containing protein [unclassified Demequina]MDN4477414.1 FAD-binding and (Fe-S)-binding domain-containing protein [Demequina sp. SYSU T00039-1]MDN4488235.1 FAD-binding and (Fe-S)-binding domain-containing protein [Demequina sp. SYSU T00039]
MTRVTTTAPSTASTELAAALDRAIDGEVDASPRRRAEYSTDASNYRIVPAVVAYPRDADDLLAALETARAAGVATTMRGGGTSVAGNAIGPGVVLDLSRHMNRILDVDLEAKTARVQPGVILSDLQKRVAGAGLRFGPDPSTSTRATLGGMIGNNACGPHAVAFGRTADNVVSLEAVDGIGRRFTAGARGVGAVPGLEELVAANLALIRQEFGRFSRQVSGYSLEHLLPELGGDLARFLVGSEGTLATILEATVRLVDVPPARLTAAFGYADMPAAADAVVGILPHRPQAVEGLDARLVARVAGATGPVPDLPEGAGWLFVEVGGETEEEARAALAALAADAGTSAWREVADPREAARLWAIRADGAGLSGRTPDNDEAWPGWEDAAVPPERLGAYLRDFDALMERHGVVGQPFGHFGDGCIHVRLGIPMQESGEPLRAFMTDAAALVASHGGSLSGEHGDGRARSELLPAMYSGEAIDLFRQVKHLFDPENVLNPGVMVDPDPLDAHLRRPAAPRTPGEGFTFPHDHGDMAEAVHRCTGVGKCRADAIGSGSGFMCPSYQATGDEKDVTRGRARVLQDAINGTLIGGLTAPEVRESLDLCLSCKACSADCPSGVDMAAYKSEVLHRTYKGRLRPATHYSIGWLPRWLKVIGLVPSVVNAVLRPAWIQRIAVSIAGMDTRRTLPRFAKPFRATEFARERRGDAARAVPRNTRVVLWADSFTDGIDPQIPTAVVEVLEDAGLDVVVVAGDACCGVTWISTGQLDGAKHHLEHLLGVLGPWAVNGVPIVGVEPSCMAVLRGDLVDLLPEDPRAAAVARGTYTLAEVLTGRSPVKPREGWRMPDLSDVTAVVQPHCHQYSVMGYAADRELLARAGATVTETSGCCGLAGNWGTEKGHYETSVKVAENSLLPALREAPEGSIYLADGVSCRTQADDLADVQGRHLAELIMERRRAAS